MNDNSKKSCPHTWTKTTEQENRNRIIKTFVCKKCGKRVVRSQYKPKPKSPFWK